MKNPPQPDDGQRHEYRIFCRAEKVGKGDRRWPGLF